MLNILDKVLMYCVNAEMRVGWCGERVWGGEGSELDENMWVKWMGGECWMCYVVDERML